MADYIRQPCYPLDGELTVRRGLDSAAAALPTGIRRLAVDGPAMPHWDAFAAAVAAAVSAAGRPIVTLCTDDLARPWPEIVELTGTAELADDPDFARLAAGTLADLLDLTRSPQDSIGQRTPRVLSPSKDRNGDQSSPSKERDHDPCPRIPDPTDELLIIYGPGAALLDADVVWWADRPKRLAEAEVTGGLEFQSVTIDPAAVDPTDVEMLQDLVLAAVRDAVDQVNELQAGALGLGDLDLGGLDLGGLLGGT